MLSDQVQAASSFSEKIHHVATLIISNNTILCMKLTSRGNPIFFHGAPVGLVSPWEDLPVHSAIHGEGDITIITPKLQGKPKGDPQHPMTRVNNTTRALSQLTTPTVKSKHVPVMSAGGHIRGHF